MESLREIGVTLGKEESSLHELRQSVYHFLCQAYILALESWGETVYETDLKTDGLHDKRKAALYALYAQRPGEDRVARCRQIVLDRSHALRLQEDLSPENQVAWLYAMVEIGEHCKANVLQFLQACGQPHINRSLRAFQVLRGDLYHTFLPERISEEDGPIVSNIMGKNWVFEHSDAVVDLFAHAPQEESRSASLTSDETQSQSSLSSPASLAQYSLLSRDDKISHDERATNDSLSSSPCSR
jgi:hypothetical protein